MQAKTYPVPYGLDVSVRITREGDTAYVDILSPMYVQKEFRVPFCFDAASYSDGRILDDRDLVTLLINRYGV